MITFDPTEPGPKDIDAIHDPDSSVSYSFIFRPSIWVTNTVYQDGEIIIPTVFSGFAFLCTSGGTSGATEPTWPNSKNLTVTDNTITWKAILYDYYIAPGENITALVPALTTGVTLGTGVYVETFSEGTAVIWIVAVTDATLTEFELTARITTSNIPPRIDDRTIRVQIKEL